jgi:predicted HicB family RNase H-like nuclease
MLKYKHYIGSFSFDEKLHLFHGQVSNISYPITFQGKSLKSTEEAFKDAVDEYIEWCRKYGKTPEKPSLIK